MIEHHVSEEELLRNEKIKWLSTCGGPFTPYDYSFYYSNAKKSYTKEGKTWWVWED